MKMQKSQGFRSQKAIETHAGAIFFGTHALGNLLRSLEVWESQVIRTESNIRRKKHKNIGKRGQAMLRQAVLPRGFQNLRRRRSRVRLTLCHVHVGDARVKVDALPSRLPGNASILDLDVDRHVYRHTYAHASGKTCENYILN